MNKQTDEMVALLKEWFPDHSPNKLFQEWQELNLDLIKAGLLAAILQPGGDVLYKHVEHCSDSELQRSMTPDQYRLFMQR